MGHQPRRHGARQQSLVPVPGGPTINTPFGPTSARHRVAVRVFEEVDNLGDFLLGTLVTGHSANVVLGRCKSNTFPGATTPPRPASWRRGRGRSTKTAPPQAEATGWSNTDQIEVCEGWVVT